MQANLAGGGGCKKSFDILTWWATEPNVCLCFVSRNQKKQFRTTYEKKHFETVTRYIVLKGNIQFPN